MRAKWSKMMSTSLYTGSPAVERREVHRTPVPAVEGGFVVREVDFGPPGCESLGLEDAEAVRARVRAVDGP